MWRRISILALCIALLDLTYAGLAYAQSDAATSLQPSILSIDAASHPDIDVMLEVRDSYGRPANNLRAGDIVLTDDGESIPNERIQLETLENKQAPLTVVVLADTSSLLGVATADTIRNDAITLIETLIQQPGIDLEIAVATPRSADATRQGLAPSFAATPADALTTARSLPGLNGPTDLYNGLIGAITLAAERAQQHQGPAYVVVLSDGMDRTSIVGAGMAGASEAARSAEAEHIPVIAFGYGGPRNNGGPMLAQLAERSGGSYQARPDAATLKSIAQQLQQASQGGLYQLRYGSARSADGAEHTLALKIKTNNEYSAIAQATYLLPKAWDSHTPVGLDLRVESQAYPGITLITRPVNQLRRTITGLSPDDFAISLDGKPISGPVTLSIEPLSAENPASAQSVAVVVEQHGSAARKLREMTSTFMAAQTDIPSRMALFIPGAAGQDHQFTHDHNALINILNQHRSGPSSDASLAATLQLAMHAAAEDADAQQRPAYVVLFSDSLLTAEERAQVATLARQLALTVHVIQSQNEPTPNNTRLAEATGGTSLTTASELELNTLAETIAKDSAQQYRLSFMADIPADGQQRPISLKLGDQVLEGSIIPLVAGMAPIKAAYDPNSLAAMFAAVALLTMAVAFVPRLINEHRLRCAKCGRVRRTSWGSACLFCEHDALVNGREQHSEVALDGFARQGASLMHGATPILPAGTPGYITPLHEHMPKVQDDDGPVTIPTLTLQPSQTGATDHGNNGTNAHHRSNGCHVSNGSNTHKADTNPSENARSRSHTDFWGSLPGEVIEPAPTPMPFDKQPSIAQPPRLPVFEQPSLRSDVEMQRENITAQDYEPSHTDFWGALPDDGNIDPVARPDRESQPEQQPEDEPGSDTDFWGLAAASEIIPGGAQQIAGNASVAPEAAEPVAHTDFWGAAAESEIITPEPGAEPVVHTSSFEEAAVSHTDFWEPDTAREEPAVAAAPKRSRKKSRT